MGQVAALAVALLLAPSAVVLLWMAAAFLYSLPAWLLLGDRGNTRIRWAVETVDEAVAHLAGTGLRGWDLVAEAQRLVNEKMEYSRRNNWDSPERAFARGMGYCQQQAEALLLILRRLGLEARLVQSTRNRFPPRRIHEYASPGGVSGHARLRVRIGGEELDVCPGHPDNLPGKTHFETLGKVTSYRGFAKVLGHFGSALLNTWWDRRDLRRAGR